MNSMLNLALARYIELLLAFIGLGWIVTTKGTDWEPWALFLPSIVAFIATEAALVLGLARPSSESSPILFDHVEAVVDHICDVNKRRLRSVEDTSIRVYGLHLGRSWNRIRTVLLQSKGTDKIDEELRNLHLRLLVLHPKSSRLETLNPRWKSSAESTILDIQTFTKEFAKQLANQNITVELRTLTGIPMRYAMIVDNDSLYVSETFFAVNPHGDFGLHASKLHHRWLTTENWEFAEQFESLDSWFEYSRQIGINALKATQKSRHN